MLRRHLLALGGVTLVGQPVKHLGELLELPGVAPGPVPLPSRILAAGESGRQAREEVTAA
jgi:hypothetical protein